MFTSDLWFTSVWPLVMAVITTGLTLLDELVFKRKQIFTLITALACAASLAALIYLGGALCDMLILIVINIAVRLVFEIRRAGK
ncbi:MAG: hypothetical protein MJ101_04415 [Clostridia bacterium]|nr:hypothetical protein [Clostridia bacterium]